MSEVFFKFEVYVHLFLNNQKVVLFDYLLHLENNLNLVLYYFVLASQCLILLFNDLHFNLVILVLE